ncbi:hypothetical protein pthi1_p30 [Paracoccus phage vB_PthS_Pthi1]|nr:hypothetical protein [Paracoccus thiocyanatus]AZV00395.1 hypothetical protein pthi1_p30 [Paracoccus phage vB_PthS_Pthi1]SIQ39875.1 hypothetical protein SAMN05421641_10793 [Paracoccus thiocyanatus]
MPKLKALRGAIGIYGRVKANGIVEVEDKDVEKLLKTKRFVRATEADIASAEKAQQDFLAVNMTGAAPGFAPVATPKPNDRLQAMIDGGSITKEKAQELVALQIELSDDEVKAALQRWMHESSAALSAREEELTAREEAHAESVADHEAEVQRLADIAADLDKREKAIAEAAAAKASALDDQGNAHATAEAKEAPKGKAAK